MSKDAAKPEGKPKGGKMKKMILIGVGATVLIGAGVGAGLYASGAGMLGEEAEHEDPNRPKLVLRSEEAAPEGGEGGEGGEKKEVAKIGTVAVKSDNVMIDRKKYEVTYYPVEGNFTANLADGSGFVQVGLSLSTYFDSKLIANVKRQMVPIRSAILLVLSDQQSAILSTPEGKAMLQRRITKAINQVLREHEGFGGVDNVYFTNLVIQ